MRSRRAANRPGVGRRIGARRPADGLLVHGHDLVEAVDALDPLVGADGLTGLVELVLQGLVEDVVDERALARAGDAGHGRHGRERDADVDRLEVVLAGLADDEPAARLAAGRRDGHRSLAPEVLGRQGIGGIQDGRERPFGDLEAAVLPRPGAEVEEIVGRTDGLLVVLDDDDRIALVAQAPEQGDEAAVVALVEADGRLVEDVEDAAEARPDLGGQPDALGLAAGEGRGRPVELEVGHAQLLHDGQAGGDLLEDPGSDERLRGGEDELGAFGQEVADRELADVVDVLPVDLDREALLAEAGAAAVGTDVVGELDLAPFVVGRLVAEAVALRAGAVGAVEREVARLELGQADLAVGAEKGLGEEALFAGFVDDEDLAFGDLEGLVHGGAQAALRVGADLDRVDEDLDRVLAVLLERDVVLEVVEGAVDADPEEALLAQALEQALVLALAALDHGGQDADLGPGGVLGDAGQDLLRRLGRDDPAAARAVGRADPGEEQAEEVVDLGDGAHGRARVGRDGLLVDGDGRRDALDGLDLGLLHLVDELAGVGREALDIAALALGEDGVEGEGRLPGAGRAGDHDQLVPGERNVDVLQIVLRRPLDAYLVEHNGLF